MMDGCVSIIAAERGELKKIYLRRVPLDWAGLADFAIFEEFVEEVG